MKLKSLTLFLCFLQLTKSHKPKTHLFHLRHHYRLYQLLQWRLEYLEDLVDL